MWGKLHNNYYIIYIVNLVISSGYVLHCGGNGWGELMEKMDVSDSRYLAILTGSNISILITYIVFVTKMQNGKPGEMDLPLWKTISQIF